MHKINLIRWGLLLLVPALACALARQTPQPAPTLNPLIFEVQTVTPTPTPIFALDDAPSLSPVPGATPIITTTRLITSTAVITPVNSE